MNNQPVIALVVLLAAVSCRCGSSSSSDAAPPADAGAAQCCYPLHDAAGGPWPCGDGGAVCNPQMPVPCSYQGAAGSVKACP